MQTTLREIAFNMKEKIFQRKQLIHSILPKKSLMQGCITEDLAQINQPPSSKLHSISNLQKHTIPKISHMIPQL